MNKEPTTGGEGRYFWLWRKIDEGEDGEIFILEQVEITYVRVS